MNEDDQECTIENIKALIEYYQVNGNHGIVWGLEQGLKALEEAKDE